jgi:hypothetical protein
LVGIWCCLAGKKTRNNTTDFTEDDDDRCGTGPVRLDRWDDDEREFPTQYYDEDIYERTTDEKHCGGVTAFAFPYLRLSVGGTGSPSFCLIFAFLHLPSLQHHLLGHGPKERPNEGYIDKRDEASLPTWRVGGKGRGATHVAASLGS